MPAAAQVGDPLNTQPIVVPNTSSSFNQQGFNLPTAPRANGQDIVRGAGGISCQSAIGSGGPSLDMGVIGTSDIFDRESAALYGRVTIPLGKRPKRVDCTRLYELEVSRLQMELEMMRTVHAANQRAQTAPIVYEDATPPPHFSLGAIAEADEPEVPAQAPRQAESPSVDEGGFVLPTQAAPRTAHTPESVRGTLPGTGAAAPPTSGSHQVQLAAYTDMKAASEARQAFALRLGLSDDTDVVVVGKTVRGRDFHTVRVVGLQRDEVEAVCAAVGGDCMRL